ncbi:nicotinate phosphoribosyltransferase [Streptomyces mirabilis]
MSVATTTDLYEVTVAMSCLREATTGPATLSLFVRNLPSDRGFLVGAGLESALDFLSGFRIGAEDADAFATVRHRPPADVDTLLGLEFTGQVRVVPEERIVLAGEPLLEVTAPLPQAQLVETYVLNQVSHQTAIASKAARCVLAAAGHPLVDFSLRRTHGPQAGFRAARLSAMVGFAGTSNVSAVAAEGLPAVGTMAHSCVEVFGTEEEAFRAFARCHPGPVTFLVDTYDTDTGVATAARVLRLHPDRTGPYEGEEKIMLHTVEWKVRLYLSEDDEGTTKARVVVNTGTTTLTGHGAARCNPADAEVPEIGDELAAGRAMHDLGQQLVSTAERDIKDLGAPATGRSPRPTAGWPV